MRNDMKRKLRFPAVLAFWLVLWLAAAAAISNPILFAGPAEVAGALFEQAGDASFWRTLSFSFGRILAGFLAASFFGVLAGAVSFRRPLIRELLSPAILFFQSIPVASFVILALVWTGSANLSVIISFMVVLPLIYQASLSGLSQTDPKLLEMCRVFRVGRIRRIRAVWLPALMPWFSGAAVSALGLAVKSGVAAEVIGVPDHSIGSRLYTAKIYLCTADLFAWTFIIIASAWLLQCALRAALSLLSPRTARSAAPPGFRFFRNFGFSRNVPFFWIFDFFRKNRRAENSGQNPFFSLSLHGLGKRYGALPVLQNLDLTFLSPGIHCIMAPSGSGKTTLFRLLAGLEAPDSGRLSFEPDAQQTGRMETACAQARRRGHTKACNHPSRQPLLRISCVFQEDRLIDAMTPLQNIALVLPGAPDISLLRRECARLLPGECLDRPVSTLSGGMKRRCALLRALLSPFDLLLLDEPFTGLDEKAKKKAARCLIEKTRGRLVLIATHSQDDALLLDAQIHRFDSFIRPQAEEKNGL